MIFYETSAKTAESVETAFYELSKKLMLKRFLEIFNSIIVKIGRKGEKIEIIRSKQLSLNLLHLHH